MKVTHISEKQQWLRDHTNRVEQMLAHFDTYRVVASSGIKGGSCCAVVLRDKTQQPVYGNSQAHKLDPEQVKMGQAHAEVVAFELSESHSGEPPSMIFCELSPCPKCQVKFALTDVEIVYLFDYNSERQKWLDFHNKSLADQKKFFRQEAGLNG